MVTEICAYCRQDVQEDWTYCPYCGAQTRLPKSPITDFEIEVLDDHVLLALHHNYQYGISGDHDN